MGSRWKHRLLCRRDYTSLAFNQSGEPYEAFTDVAHACKAFVMKFKGTNWLYVGNAGFSPSSAYYISLAYSPSDGQPYIAYQDENNQGKATVMKFNGIRWVYAGTAGGSASGAGYFYLSFSPSDSLPYIAYRDYAYLGKATVMEFDGINWGNIGMAGFSAAAAYFVSLAINSTGLPFVAFSDDSHSGKAKVMYNVITTGIKEQTSSRFAIYPNPASDKITVETSATSSKNILTVLNIHGQQLLSRPITGPKTQLDISGLSAGMYFLRLIGDTSFTTGKFIVLTL